MLLGLAVSVNAPIPLLCSVFLPRPIHYRSDTYIGIIGTYLCRDILRFFVKRYLPCKSGGSCIYIKIKIVGYSTSSKVNNVFENVFKKYITKNELESIKRNISNEKSRV